MPFGYPYEVSSEFEVGDYRVPSCDLLLLNFRSCHMDYTYWKRPAEFRPENFTDSDGQLVQHEAFLPYGLGIVFKLLIFLLILNFTNYALKCNIWTIIDVFQEVALANIKVWRTKSCFLYLLISSVNLTFEHRMKIRTRPWLQRKDLYVSQNLITWCHTH